MPKTKDARIIIAKWRSYQKQLIGKNNGSDLGNRGKPYKYQTGSPYSLNRLQLTDSDCREMETFKNINLLIGQTNIGRCKTRMWIFRFSIFKIDKYDFATKLGECLSGSEVLCETNQ